METTETYRIYADRFEIHIQTQMPYNFDDQVRLFSGAALLIAPNGGWKPNVLRMSDTACLLEIHLYKIDSWIEMFGLASLFEPRRFMTVSGNYHNETASPRTVRPHRKGGSNEIQGALLGPDVAQALRKSHGCRRFLRA